MNRSEPASARSLILAAGFFVSVCSVGCGTDEPDDGLTATRGIIHVDGTPASGVVISLHGAAGRPPVAQAITRQDGSFEISTRVEGDGAEPGTYQVTMVWSTFDAISRSQQGDRLGGRYARPGGQSIRWDIPAEGDYDLGTIELSTP